MKLKTFQETEEFLSQFIPQTDKNKYQGGFGLDRATYFFKLLGNPQNNLRTIHIAGTSGKGSTAYLTSKLLQAQEFSVGLFLSPHLTTVRERIQINDTFTSEKEFVGWVNYLLPFIQRMEKTEFGKPSWFEIITAIGFCHFYTHKVEYAVIETGLGGLYDATNTIENPQKLVLLTKIGLDHTQILGNTLPKIAAQKAGIIHKNNIALSVDEPSSVRSIFDSVAKKEKTSVTYIEKKKNVANVSVHNNKTYFDYSFEGLKLKNVELGMPGLYQAENASLALSALKILSERDDFEIDEQAIRKTLSVASFGGRFEIKKVKGKTLILDGAHNPQKMKNFTESLGKLYPNQKFTFVISFKKGKDYEDMLKYIVPLAEHIILTEFVSDQEFAPIAEKAETIAKLLDKLDFKKYEVIPDIKEAFITAFKNSQHPIVATGSLYFLSNVYRVLQFDII